MRGFWPRLIEVAVVALVATSALAQIPTDGLPTPPQPLPPVAMPPVQGENLRYFSADRMAAGPTVAASADRPLTPDPSTMGLNPTLPEGVLDRTVALDSALDLQSEVEPAGPDPIEDFLGYRYEVTSTEWMIGSGEQFGMFSLNWGHYQGAGLESGLGGGVKLHFVGGPVSTDMPPRLYDFSLAWQHRDRLGALHYDVAFSVMASSDFEGSAREGIRFPAHAVGFLFMGTATELVFGVDYLHRGDVKLLPVGGLILVPSPDLRLELVFPRPRVVFRLTEEYQLYLGGELGGNTWAVERDSELDDLATYRDLRLCIGLQSKGGGAIEIAYLFDRELQYTSGQGNLGLDDTAMIRLVSTF